MLHQGLAVLAVQLMASRVLRSRLQQRGARSLPLAMQAAALLVVVAETVQLLLVVRLLTGQMRGLQGLPLPAPALAFPQVMP